MLLNNFKNRVNRFFNLFFRHWLTKNDSICRIEEIDLRKNFIIIHCRGIQSPIKLRFNEIINDYAMLSNFSPKHASWIGYYYGKYYKGLLNKGRYCNTDFNFSEGYDINRFNITMITRHGDLVYIDHSTNITHTIRPDKIMGNQELISQFTPIQACYIGILSGASKEEILKRKLRLSKRVSHLKLIK